MKFLRIVFLSLFTCLLCNTIFSQTPPPLDKKAQKAADKQHKREAKEKAYQEQNQYKFTSEYDKFKDSTRVFTQPLSLVGNEDDGRSLDYYVPTTIALVYRFTGQEQKGVIVNGYLEFDSHSKDWVYLRDHDLIILADGKRFLDNKVTHDGDVGRNSYSVSVSESMISGFPLEELKKISEAKEVLLRLGIREFRLTDTQIKGLAEMVSRMSTTIPKP